MATPARHSSFGSDQLPFQGWGHDCGWEHQGSEGAFKGQVESISMKEQNDNDLFWDVVKACLHEIYGLGRSEATTKSKRLRTTVEKTPTKSFPGLFYHAEPLDVAGDIAGRKCDLSEKERKKYDAILARRGW
jgi:hypothetical protein